MSYLSQTLKRLMQVNGVTGAAIQKKTGLKKASVSRWVNAHQRFIEPGDLALLASAITRDRKERAELIAAHLHDELQDTGPGSELIDIIIHGAGESFVMHDKPAGLGVKLSPSDEAAVLNLLAKIPSNPAILKSLKGLNEAT